MREPGRTNRRAAATPPLRRRRIVVVGYQDTMRCALKIFVLARPQTPEEGGKPHHSHEQRDRDQDDHDVHVRRQRNCKRNAFNVTISEEPDIASAAINGVRKPAAANGAAMML